ncbi:MAG: penicillin-binding transpeptidase domain-containing protein [Bacillota bacterium]|nr:penicillin-binding transpeptidase domain-containing protein [Bacillota bacterium]
MENQVSHNRLRTVICLVLIMAIFTTFTARLYDWQITQSSKYRSVAEASTGYTVKTDATRGEILDRNGASLAVNVTGYKIVLNKLYLESGIENQVIARLIDLLETRNEKWVDNLPIKLDSNGHFSFISNKKDEIATLEGKDMLNMNSYSTADQCMDKLIARYGVKEFNDKKKNRDIASVRYNMELSGYNNETPYTFATGISQDMVAIVSENCQAIPGVEVQTSMIRTDENGSLAPNIIGTTGSISADEYAQLSSKGYGLNDTVGKSGIEAAFESYLRGTPGSEIVERTPGGSVINTSSIQNAKPGDTVYLTLDSKLQEVANKALKTNIEKARAAGSAACAATGGKHLGEDCHAGAVVMLNVKDFSVLAAASYPSYDLQKYTSDDQYCEAINNDKTAPLFDRAFIGSFAPGSVFKPMVALAALQEHVITPNTTYDCEGVYKYPTNSSFKVYCWDHSGHGYLDLYGAIAQSCDVYFANVGMRLGISSMYQYAERFGLGEKTGVEIPESVGTLAGRDSQNWQGGNVISAAIGQSDNAFTPAQLATYVATIANNGIRLKTHLVSKITDYTRKKTIVYNDPNKPEIIGTTGISSSNLKAVQDAMREDVTSEKGTAYSAFGNYGIAIASKTGTAENDSGSDHTTFICYAPYDHPQVAIAVVLEHGAKGTYSMGVAKALLDEYFKSQLSKSSTNH